MENNKSLNFIGLRITRTADKFCFKIYSKPTTSHQTIHGSSHHPISQEMAAYHSFVNRLLSIPLKENDYIEEVSIIKFSAVANGDKSNIVDKIISNHKKTQYL